VPASLRVEGEWLADDPTERRVTPTAGVFWLVRRLTPKDSVARDFCNLFRNYALSTGHLGLDGRTAGSEGCLALWCAITLILAVPVGFAWSTPGAGWSLTAIFLGGAAGEALLWFSRRTRAASLSRRNAADAVVAFPTSAATEWLFVLIGAAILLSVRH
jgi:hypothetical protein